MRIQGLGVLRRVQESMARNEMPLQEVFDGLCLLVAGALLLTPGFITDAVGFCLLFPPFRRAFGASVVAGLVKRGQTRTWHSSSGPTGSGGAHGSYTASRGNGPIIDGEFEDLSETPSSDDRAPSISDERRND